jgi:hypothetical protein
MIFKQAVQWLVQPVNIDATIYITTCVGIGEIWTVGKLPQPHLVKSCCSQMHVSLRMAASRPAGEAGHVIRAYLSLRAATIDHHSHGALLWIVCKE